MRRELMEKIYENPEILDYLRHHPKWYYFLDSDEKNFTVFMNTAKKELKVTPYDKLEKIKKQVNFASSMIDYFTK